MAKQFDATLKHLIDRYGGEWAAFASVAVGLPPGTALSPLDPDLSTISPQSDKLFRVAGPAGGAIHLELQSSWADDLPARLHLYNTLAERQAGPPVRTVVLLLRRHADGPALTPPHRRADEQGEYLTFRYTVVRLWQEPCEPFLTGPPGLVPLALLTDDAAPDLAGVLRRADERFAALPPSSHAELLSACNILMGLRYNRTVVQSLFQRLPTMRDSDTYMAILEEGELVGELRALRESITDLATDRLGEPPTDFVNRLSRIADRGRLRRMNRRVPTAANWADLLATP